MIQLPPIAFVRPVLELTERLVDEGRLRTNAYDILEAIDLVRLEFRDQASDAVGTAAMLAHLVLLDIDTSGASLDSIDRQLLETILGQPIGHFVRTVSRFPTGSPPADERSFSARGLGRSSHDS